MVRIALSPELASRTTIPTALKRKQKAQSGSVPNTAAAVGAVLEWPNANPSQPILVYENHQALRSLLFPALPTASSPSDISTAASDTLAADGTAAGSSTTPEVAQRTVVALMETIHLYLYDFTKNVVLSHVTPTLSLDELHLPSLTPGAAAGVARRSKGEGGGTLGYGGVYDYWVGNDLANTTSSSSVALNGDSSSGSDNDGGGGYLASRGGGSKSHKAASALEGRLSTSAGRFGLYMSLAPLALSTTDAGKQQASVAVVDHSLTGGGVFKFTKHFCGQTLFMGNGQDTRVKKVCTPDNGGGGGGGGSSWANSFAAATASASPLTYLNFTPPSSNGGIATPTTADLLVTFQVGTLGSTSTPRPTNLQFDPFAVNGGGGLVPQSMVGMCTRNVATHASASTADVPLVTAWASRAFDGVGSSSGVAGWMFDVVTGALYTLHITPNRHATITLVSKVENYCDITCVAALGDNSNNNNGSASSQYNTVVGTGDNRTTTYNIQQSSQSNKKSSSQRQLCPPITMHVSLPLGLGGGHDTSDMLTTATLTIICKGRMVHSTTFQTTRVLLESMMPCVQIYDDATTIEIW